MDNSFKIRKGLNIEPIAGAAPTAEGDITYDLTAHKASIHNGTTASPLVTEASTATIAAATSGNAATATTATLATTATNIAGGSGGSIPYQSAADTTALLANGTAGKVLTSAGTTLAPTWETPAAGGGVTTMGAIGSSPNANAGTITGVTLNLEPASASYGGIVTTGTQTIAGAKTFTGSVAINRAADAVQLYVQGHSTQTSHIFDIYNSSFTTLAYVDNSGNFYAKGAITQLAGQTITSGAFISQTANPSTVGAVRLSNTEGIGWRNAANGANYTLILDSANTLQSTAPLTSINLNSSYTTTATAAGTTTLTVASNKQQFFTGTTTQTVVLPVTSTLALGWSYEITNNSTGIVTVQSSGANTILAQAPLTTAKYTCILTSGTTAASWSMTGAVVAPTVQKVTASGTGTYTTPTTPRVPLYLRVRLVGGGGGGGGGGTAGTNGGNSYFRVGASPDLLVANGGTAGNGGGQGAGGTASLGTGPIGTALSGGTGKSGQNIVNAAGGSGGNTFWAGGGSGGTNSGAGAAGQTNTGGGGGGGGGDADSGSAGGGGAGGQVDAIIFYPVATYEYNVGAGGAGAAAGSSLAGGAGADSYLEVTEFYQ